MTYDVVTKNDLTLFCKTVNDYINSGWKPVGGVTAFTVLDHGVYMLYWAQGIILNDADIKLD